MFKCVTMAKCGYVIIIDDKFNKVSVLNSKDFSVVYQKTIIENDDDNFQYVFSAGAGNEKLFVGYDSNRVEVWDGKTFKCITTLDLQ